MIECLIIGDSIAVGVAQYATQCNLQGKIGITSNSFADVYIVKNANLTVISLGSNDRGYDPYAAMKKIRDTIDGKVIWLISANSLEGATASLRVAYQYGDGVFHVGTVELSSDGVHPTVNGLKKISSILE